MNKKVVELLKEKKWHVSFAESMTGGACASYLVLAPGASNVMEKSFVTYSNQAKHDLLGVSLKLIDKFGVVSAPVAIKMASGLQKKTKSEVCVSVTGYAGPPSLNQELEGEVYVAIKVLDEISCYHFTYPKPDNRESIIMLTRDRIFAEIINKLMKGE